MEKQKPWPLAKTRTTYLESQTVFNKIISDINQHIIQAAGNGDNTVTVTLRERNVPPAIMKKLMDAYEFAGYTARNYDEGKIKIGWE